MKPPANGPKAPPGWRPPETASIGLLMPKRVAAAMLPCAANDVPCSPRCCDFGRVTLKCLLAAA